MFIDFKVGTLKVKVSENYGKFSFLFSASDFHSVKPGFTNHVLLV